MDSLKDTLNKDQFDAVVYTDGPELIIAGAGSGKTRVLTYKIAYLLQSGYKPWNILALTFTNKAAREMKERVGQLVGADVARYLNMGTFHSVFLRILRAEADLIGFQRNFSIYDDSDSRTLVSSIVKELKLDDKLYKPSSVLSRIGAAKNSLIAPDVYMSDGQLLERDRRANMSKTGLIYSLYAQRCHSANAVDFDDMLFFTYQLFSKYPEVCRKYAGHFQYILVDEYQDTNYAQQSILTLLTKEQKHICVVGDDAQSIYAFRGADIDNILNFQKIYPDSRLFKLEQNYRSTQTIVEAANGLISHNVRQIHKTVYSKNGDGEKIKLCIAYSDKEEANIVGRSISRMCSTQGLDYRDFAILYRTNAQSRLFEEELRKQDIPYRIYGGMSFYQHKEIKDIIAYFRLVANPNDEEALKRVVNYPKRGIGNTTIDKLIIASRSCNVSLWTVMGEPMMYNVGVNTGTARKVVAFHDMIEKFISNSRSVDAYTLGKQILDTSGIIKEIASDNSAEGLDRKENVEGFLSGLHDFVDTKNEEGFTEEVYIENFLQEVALLTDADNDKENEDNGQSPNRVSLMTIHASKGLEFNTVFVVGMEENIFPTPRACDFPRDLEEERRLFYVAMTRAEKRCVLTCAKSRYQYGNMMFNEPSRFLKEIDSKWLEVSGGTGFRQSYRDDKPKDFNPFSASSFSLRQNAPSTCSTSRPVSKQSSFVNGAGSVGSRRPASNVGKVNQSIAPGQVIEHQRFGIGKILRVEGSGENEKATVEFKNVGIKTLLLKFARFSVVGRKE